MAVCPLCYWEGSRWIPVGLWPSFSTPQRRTSGAGLGRRQPEPQRFRRGPTRVSRRRATEEEEYALLVSIMSSVVVGVVVVELNLSPDMTGYGKNINRRRLRTKLVGASLSHTISHPSIPPQISCSIVIENIPEILDFELK